MRTQVVRHKLVVAAVMLAGSSLLAACTGSPTTPVAETSNEPTPTTSAPAKPAYPAGTVLVSNGTTTVRIGGDAVTFPTKVTDAAFSHDGSRIAFIDGDGNVATAKPDGTDVVVLTKKKAGYQRSSPTWGTAANIMYTRREPNGTARVLSVLASPGSAGDGFSHDENPPAAEEFPQTGNTAPSGAIEETAGVEYAFQHTANGVAEVWVVDTNQRVPSAYKLTKGSAAEVSPDGSKVAYVAANGQISVLAVKDSKAKPVQVTFGAKSPSHLAWSGDGKQLAFGTADAVLSVSAEVAPGATANPTTTISTTAGVPTFKPASRDVLSKVTDPVAASVAFSQKVWPTMPKYIRAEGFRAYDATLTGKAVPADAIAATSLRGGPLLINSGDRLSPAVATEMRRIFGGTTPDSRPTVTILGGFDVVSQAAENDVKALGYATERIASGYLDHALPESLGYADTIFVADSGDPGSMARATSFGWSQSVVFSKGGELSAATKKALNTAPVKAKVIPLDALAAKAVKATWSGKPKFTIAAIMTQLQWITKKGPEIRGIVIVDRSAPSGILLAASLVSTQDYTLVVLDGDQKLDPALDAWTNANAAFVDTVLVIDPAGRINPAIGAAAAKAAASDLGYTETTIG